MNENPETPPIPFESKPSVPVSQTPFPTPTPPAPPKEEASEPEVKGKSNKKTIIIILVVVAGVIIAIPLILLGLQAYFWAATINSRLGGQTMDEESLTSTTSLNIANVVCGVGSPNDYINVTIQNTGSNTISAGTTALVLMDDGDSVIKVATTDIDSLAQNQIITIDYDIGPSGVLVTDTAYNIKITFPGGAEQTSDCVAE